MKALVKFHRDFVIATLIEVIGLDKVRGRPSADVVKEYYRRLPKAAQELVTHDDPLGLAFKLAGEPQASHQWREQFECLKKSFSFHHRRNKCRRLKL